MKARTFFLALMAFDIGFIGLSEAQRGGRRWGGKPRDVARMFSTRDSSWATTSRAAGCWSAASPRRTISSNTSRRQFGLRASTGGSCKAGVPRTAAISTSSSYCWRRARISTPKRSGEAQRGIQQGARINRQPPNCSASTAAAKAIPSPYRRADRRTATFVSTSPRAPPPRMTRSPRRSRRRRARRLRAHPQNRRRWSRRTRWPGRNARGRCRRE